jgi:hypothetical protein
LEFVFPDRVRELELGNRDHEIISKDGYSCLKLEMADSYCPLSVAQFIRVILWALPSLSR